MAKKQVKQPPVKRIYKKIYPAHQPTAVGFYESESGIEIPCYFTMRFVIISNIMDYYKKPDNITIKSVDTMIAEAEEVERYILGDGIYNEMKSITSKIMTNK